MTLSNNEMDDHCLDAGSPRHEGDSTPATIRKGASMAATTTLDDPATPTKLHEISEAMKEARYLDDRGRMHALDLELSRICSRIRDEVRDLQGRADPDLLIALWSTAQISHADGLEYARTDSGPGADAVSPQ
jgi:hypothetical protein